MARNMYGATSADFTTSGGRVVAGAVLTAWTARTGGTQVTDLLDADSVACTTVTSGADGSVVFYGVDAQKDTLWLDSGQGSRIAVRPVDITGETGATPALTIGTVTTGAAAATITGTDEDPVLNLTIPPAANDSITSAMIAADAVGTSEIAANAVGSSELADSAVDTAAIADGAVTSAKIADGTIVAADVAADQFAAFRTVGNLLTANQASGTDTLADTTGFVNVFYAAALASSTATAAQGSRCLSVTLTSTSGSLFATPGGTGAVPVTPGDTLTVTAQSKAAATGKPIRLSVDFYDAGGSPVSGGTSGAFLTNNTTGWVTHWHTVTVPGTAVFMRMAVTINSNVIGETHYFDKFGIWRGTPTPLWAMPGVPIPGTSRIAVNNAVDLSGTGVPEGAVTAAPGSTWLQVDATTDVKGWIRWVKATGTGNTGWQVDAEYDSGPRDLAAVSMSNSWAVSGSLFKLQRVGRTVSIDAAFTKASASADAAYTLPAGFRPQQATVRRVADTDTADDFVTVSITSAGVISIVRSSMTSNIVYLSLSFLCATTAPSSLPGS